MLIDSEGQKCSWLTWWVGGWVKWCYGEGTMMIPRPFA